VELNFFAWIPLEFLFRTPDFISQTGTIRDGVQHRLTNGSRNGFLKILLQVPDPGPFSDPDLTLVRRRLADEESQKGRFAGPVRPNKPHALARFYLKADVSEDRFSGKG
jgi:hypothetical protein